MRPGEDPRRRLALQVAHRLADVVPGEEPVGASLDEAPNERPVLVERGTSVGSVLLERERQIGAGVEILVERGERAEAEVPKGVVEMRRAHRNFLTTRSAPSLLPVLDLARRPVAGRRAGNRGTNRPRARPRPAAASG